SDLAGARTQDPLLKREMLYQLSYQIVCVCGCKYKIFRCFYKLILKNVNTKNNLFKVPRAGVEPARPNGHMALNHACLPIPAPGPLLRLGNNTISTLNKPYSPLSRSK